MSTVDAISIGGGLAGAAFALELGRHGVRVLVLEKSWGPAPKVCGDFLSDEALDLLAYLGLDVAHLGASSIDTLTFATKQRAATIGLPIRAAGLSRRVLDEALLQLAENAGAHVERGMTVTSLKPGGRSAVVEAGRARFEASAVALSTGKHNLRGWSRRAGAATAFKLQFTLSSAARQELIGRVQLVLFEGGYVGACLVENEVATICWQIETRLLKQIGSNWETHLAAFAGQSPFLGDLIAGASPRMTRPVAVAGIPFGYPRRQMIADTVFPIGDQIAVIPAFTGDGTSIALASGIRAAQAFITGDTGRYFQSSFVRGLSRQFAVASTVSALFRTEPTRRLSIATVRLFPSLAVGLVRATRLRSITRPALSGAS